MWASDKNINRFELEKISQKFHLKGNQAVNDAKQMYLYVYSYKSIHFSCSAIYWLQDIREYLIFFFRHNLQLLQPYPVTFWSTWQFRPLFPIHSL